MLAFFYIFFNNFFQKVYLFLHKFSNVVLYLKKIIFLKNSYCLYKISKILPIFYIICHKAVFYFFIIFIMTFLSLK